MRFSLCFLLLCSFSMMYAQKGNVLIKNYKNSLSKTQSTSVLQASDGRMYFATPEGIVLYDGVEWQTINIGITPYVLTLASDGRIYVGCRQNFGYLETNSFGELEFKSVLKENKNVGDITEVAAIKDKIYFYTNTEVFLYSSRDNTVSSFVKAPEKTIFTGWLIHKDGVYLNVSDQGLHEAKNQKLTPFGNQLFANNTIISFFQYNDNNTCIASDDSRLWLFNGSILQPLQLGAQQYLQENIIQTAISLSKDEYALGTVTGGVLIINKKTGITQKIISYETGLADNEVLALCNDNQSGLWICHAEGIARAALKVPIYGYNTYPGLQGKVLTVRKVNNVLYVATNEGVFYLSASNKDDVSQQIAYQRQRAYQANVQKQRNAAWSRPKRLSVRNIRNKFNSKPQIVAPQVVTVVVDRNVYEYNYSNYLAEWVPYNFRKVSGINAKCKQLIQIKNRLIAVTNAGLYQISGNSSDPILEDENVNYIAASSVNDSILYVATEKGVLYLQENQGTWGRTVALKGLSTNITSIAQHNNALWLGSDSQLFKVELTSQGIFTGKLKNFVLESNINSKTYATLLKGKPVFFTSKGVYTAAYVGGDLILPDNSLAAYHLKTTQLYLNQNDHLWALHQNQWLDLNRKDSSSLQSLGYLTMIKDIQDVYETSKQEIWVASEENLYRIAPDEIDKQLSRNNKLFVKSVLSKDGQPIALQETELSRYEEAQNFSFLLASPFFLSETDTKFQYYLKGLDGGEWSDWRNQASIEFPFLPSGRYELQVRSKNALGNVSEPYHFNFYIKPPFWETWWFYGFQIVILAGMLLVAVIFNRRGAESRVASVITLVTIITIFEFIVLAIEPYLDSFSGGVPIFKLLANIALAVSLVPLEKRVRHYLRHSHYLDTIAEKLHIRKRLDQISTISNMTVNQIKDMARSRRNVEEES